MNVVEELLRAREAFDRRDWVAAYDGLSAAGSDAPGRRLRRLATAAFLSAVTTTASRRSSGRTRRTSTPATSGRGAVAPSGWR